MLKANLKNDLTKLPIAERLDLMMQFRANEITRKKNFMSESEYYSIDASIKTNEEIRAYNNRNQQFLELMYRADDLFKKFMKLMMSINFFKSSSFSKFQINSNLDDMNFFLYLIQSDLDERAKSIVYKSLEKVFSDHSDLEYEIKIYEDEKNYKFLDAIFKPKDTLQKMIESEVNLINTLIKIYLEYEVKYIELAEKYDMHLKSFEENISMFTQEIQNNLNFLKTTLHEEISDKIDFRF